MIITSEDVLLEDAKNGDIKAFERLITGYEKLIFNVAYRMMGNMEDAKDMAQEAMLKIYRNIDKCRDMRSFKSWICTITNNTCIDELRKRKNKYTYSLDSMVTTDEGEMEQQIESNEPNPEMVMVTSERAKQIQKAINQLKSDHKTLIVLRDIKGLSYEELADVTGVSIGTVKSRLSRARDNLKIILSDMMEQNLL